MEAHLRVAGAIGTSTGHQRDINWIGGERSPTRYPIEHAPAAPSACGPVRRSRTTAHDRWRACAVDRVGGAARDRRTTRRTFASPHRSAAVPPARDWTPADASAAALRTAAKSTERHSWRTRRRGRCRRRATLHSPDTNELRAAALVIAQEARSIYRVRARPQQRRSLSVDDETVAQAGRRISAPRPPGDRRCAARARPRRHAHQGH